MNDIDYNTGLCDCAQDMPSCVETYVCPHIVISQQYNMLAEDKASPNWMMCASMFLLDVMATGCFAAMAGSINNRSMARRRLGLTARTPMQDFCTVLWCRPCSDCQIYREMSIRNTWPGGFCLIDQPYTKPGLLAPVPATMGVPVQDSQELYPVQRASVGVPVRDGYDLVANKSPKACDV